MRLEIGKNQGHIIVDDNTGKILSVLVKEAIEDKFDFRAFTSYRREKNKHFNMREKSS